MKVTKGEGKRFCHILKSNTRFTITKNIHVCLSIFLVQTFIHEEQLEEVHTSTSNETQT